ncbi:MAG: hypothetical protein AMK73_08065 [Planctomycetes bacterium SM23_32]|nr:MAG: hypothetical protein AMK73_08065 [Planctomycetes bacterium SM23_32]
MTWRAFIIGLVGVVGLCLLVPVNDYRIGNTFLTGNHFPAGVFAFLVFLTLGVNLLLRLVRRAWMLRQSELMLVWCMMIVASTVPASGLMRNLLPAVASAPYLSQRPDLYWEDDVLAAAPDGILLSKDPRSPAARKFFEGTPEGEPVRVPWRQWSRVLTTWGAYIWLYYLATFFLGGILRRQWVDAERLMFATARVPLEFTEGAREGRALPAPMRSKAFLVGALLTIAFGLIRLSPLLFGADMGWLPLVPFWRVFSETSLHYVNISDGKIYPLAIGFAFLVPSDVSLSIWFFYTFMCLQIVIAHSIGLPLEGGRSGPFLQWQQAGAFLTLAGGMLYMARWHLWAVLRQALGRSALDDSKEPIGYRLSFWGLLAALAGLVAWNVYFGVGAGTAVALVALTFTVVMVHCRMVAQGGLFFTQHYWSPSWFLHGVSGGRIFSAPAAVVASVQGQVLIHDCRELLGPHAMNALRISSVFERRRRLFLPIMLVTLAVALAVAGYSSLRWVYYDRGALNVPIGSSHVYHMTNLYNSVHLMISKPWQSADPRWGGLATGAAGMAALLGLRGLLYWWPVHPLGFAMAVSWCTRELWFSFFLGWLAKTLALKIGGNALRNGRNFLLGVIIGEATMVALATFGSLLTGVRTGVVFLSH